VLVDGLSAPTALASGPRRDPLTGGAQRLYVAQLNGGENDKTGQIIAIDQSGETREVILNNLNKPTGLAWFNDTLYVVAFRDVLMFTAREGALSGPKTLVKDVRFNGRSLGHITVGPTPDPFTGESEPRVYFHSSGGDPAASGRIYSMRRDGSDLRTVARGLKNAYAFTWALTDSTMFATEISEDFGNPPVEEINVIQQNGDYGWPDCAAGAACGNTPKPLATFSPNSTPTGIVWWEDSLIVTLWGPNDPHVAQVLLPTGTVNKFATGSKTPIDVTFNWLGHLLILDFAGTIYEVWQPSPGSGQIAPPQPSSTP
jgi:glucose/arabinose dehydrogenase